MTTQPGHVDILLPQGARVSPGEDARPEPLAPLSPATPEEQRIRRPPPNVGTLGRGRIFVQKASEPAQIVDPASTPIDERTVPLGEAPPLETRRWPWVVVLLLMTLGGAGAAGWVYRDRILRMLPTQQPPPTAPLAAKEEALRSVLAEIPPAAAFFNTGPFDEPRLGDAFFAPDGRRHAYLYREGGEYGLAGAGREKTANMLELNGRRIHLGASTDPESTHRRAGYFEATDRFWYLELRGEKQRLILEDDHGEEFDAIGRPVEASKDKQIGYWAKRGDRWFVVVGDWMSAPYEQPIQGPWFSPNGDAFAFVVGGMAEQTRRGMRQVVFCSIETKACDKRPNNAVRSIQEYLAIGSDDELFFALDWYASESSAESNENLEKMAVTRKNGRWQYAAITRGTASMTSVPLGDGIVDLIALAGRAGIERPALERIRVSPDGGALAMVVSGRTYVAGDGIMLRKSKSGEVALTPEYVRCKFGSKPFAPRDWLVMSKDESKIAYCLNEPAQGERVVVNELKMKPYTYVMSSPVFAPDGSTVAYFAIKERDWWAVVGTKEDGPYDELFGEPRFSADGSQVWYGARRGRTLYFVRLSLKALSQPADAAVDL